MKLFPLFKKKKKETLDDIIGKSDAEMFDSSPKQIESKNEQIKTNIEEPVMIDRLEMYGYLDILINDEKAGIYQLSEKPLQIGRDPEKADVVISETIVSKLHCTIYIKDNAVWIKDHDSTNGTYINDQKVLDQMIPNRTMIWLGKKGLVKMHYYK